jgi:hypothetical protein
MAPFLNRPGPQPFKSRRIKIFVKILQILRPPEKSISQVQHKFQHHVAFSIRFCHLPADFRRRETQSRRGVGSSQRRGIRPFKQQ